MFVPSTSTFPFATVPFNTFPDSVNFVSGSPREVLRTSFRADLITDDIWLEMLKVRNELSHDYDGEIVLQHCQTIIHTYVDMLSVFQEKVEELLE